MDRKQNILLVDDSENDLLLMRLAFQKAGSTCLLQEVHNGEEAIAYLKGQSPYNDRTQFPLPTVVLLDINMPMKDGFAVLEWARAQPALKRLSIIMLTASMRREDVEQAFDLGANSFLVKPTNLGELTKMLRCLSDWLAYDHLPPSDCRAMK
jgi:CheY-like chemotaxis protein